MQLYITHERTDTHGETIIERGYLNLQWSLGMVDDITQEAADDIAAIILNQPRVIGVEVQTRALSR